jgi:hypothetical protein
MARKLLVYVQAVPISIQSNVKSFSDLSNARFKMAHSSKLALDRAKQLSEGEIVAVGHSSILPEAIARGATRVIPVPLCEDPLKQAESIKEFLQDSNSSVLIGENLDGPFTGAALCGALSPVSDQNLFFDSNSKNDLTASSIVLLRDNGIEAFHIDIRRIEQAASKRIEDSPMVGRSSIEKIKTKEPPEQQPREESSEEIASLISRKLRRFPCSE